MKRLLIAGLSLFIFCITSSLAIGEDLVASLPQADTVKNVSGSVQAPESQFIKEFKEKNRLAQGVKCGTAICGAGEVCCTSGETKTCKIKCNPAKESDNKMSRLQRLSENN